ncbi:LacI family DNA-binding transcriptional regulator [Fictibacillus sp. 18YEL24]|uniref:LacI family DNA-binding transcriptional regulator n=1 Tax=Fictibacillus sp. 18YEL24 TaxID=2745875 RepID=UPI0018CCB67A|nr:LacI family DNA-binding transcriptional regulator [Fictibacillus sp. 18YEL24]MBH0171455.1 LacI family DNA-binding transcriptional regulator [Fictibacillus sp. 18YEL24]
MASTIKDVAKKANVSIATVSRILNGQKGYSSNTKGRVLEVIEELGYHPNAVARGLISKRTHTIGVLFPYLSGSLVTDLLRGIEKAASAKGSSVIVCHTESDEEKTMKYLQLLGEKRVDGIIYTSQFLKEEHYQFLNKINVPIVLLSSKSDKFPIPYVKVDDFKAAYSATEYLINKGHVNIGMLSGSEKDRIAGKPRMDGFLKALESNNLPLDKKNIIDTGGFGFDKGAVGFEKLLKVNHGVTAVFAASDELAIGAMFAAYQRGISVPDEISIIGYDNINYANLSVPALTTVQQPFVEMGEMAGNMILDMLETNTIPKSQIVQHEIIERLSVKERS